LYFVVKRVKGIIEGDVCDVVDDEIVSYNFRGKLDKGVKVTSIFRRNQNDSTWYLDGTWKTNSTKKYYSVTGKVNLAEEKDLANSKIFPHLEELNLANDIAFYKDRKEGTPIVRLVKPEKIKTEYSTKIPPVSTTTDIALVSPGRDLQRAEASPIPSTSTKSLTAIDETNKTSTASFSPERTADIITAEFKEDIIAVKKPATDLPKTDTKNLLPGTGTNRPATALSPADKTADIIRAEMDENVAAVKKPANDLPKTDTKNLLPATGTNKPATTLNPVDKTADIIRAEMDESVAAVKKPATDLPRTNAKNIPVTTVALSQPVENKSRAENMIPATTGSVNKPTEIPANTIAEKKKIITMPDRKNIARQEPPVKSSTTISTGQPVAKTTVPVTTNNPVPEKKEIKKEPVNAVAVIPEEKKPMIDITAKAAIIAGRKSEFSQIVSYKSDSLELSLYDNGEIDGDTVSIYLNGEVVMAKQGLKASAIKKTIYIKQGEEDFTLVLFAENLGKYPPNTGLLVVHDGNDVYNLRFSSDFEKNAGIVFRRKK
ncbi:MAG: hypothetical protein ABI688_05605, partial [Bacteroidota bacterium]